MELLFVRHSHTVLDRELPNKLWKLSEKGIIEASLLAKSVSFEDCDLYVTSPQLKAIHTCVLLASYHPAPIEIHAGLDETSSVTNQFVENFDEEMKLYLTSTDYSINAGETSQQAKERFIETINEIIVSARKQGKKKVVVISHGTVLSLFSAEVEEKSSYEMHHSIAMPDLAIFDPEKNIFTKGFQG